MTNPLDEIRKRLQNNSQTKAPSSQSGGDVYRFWDAPVGSTTVIRFLNDGDPDNVYFWRERQMINLTFASVEGHPEMKNVTVKVPCVEMYGKNEKCPILTETRPWWKTEKEELARRYWPTKNYLYQGFVRESNITEENPPENPIRRFVISKSIHKIIKASLLDPEIEVIPTDIERGTDFKIVKEQDGKYASYGTSGFARRESALTAQERDAIDQYGLFDLSGFLPRKPTEQDLSVIYDMFVESMKGEDSVYRLEWASHYKPYNLRVEEGTGSPLSSQAPATPTVATEASTPVQESAPAQEAAPTNNTDEILAKIRSRINK